MMCLALAAGGADGIVRMLELLEEELSIALALLGVCRVIDLNPRHVTTVEPLPFQHALNSAFPLLTELKIQ